MFPFKKTFLQENILNFLNIFLVTPNFNHQSNSYCSKSFTSICIIASCVSSNFLFVYLMRGGLICNLGLETIPKSLAIIFKAFP
nr:MAG TPA: hypothetical protein [Caudoviricetes sp.]